MRRLRCFLRRWHYLDNLGGIWCCRDCGKSGPKVWLIMDSGRWR